MGRLGRLVWACLLCLDLGEGNGVVRKACPKHGKGDHVKRVRV